MYTCSARRLLSSHATLRPAFTSRKISLSASVAKTLTPGHRQILSHQGTIRFASDTSTQQGSGHRTPLTTATEVSEKSVTPEESLLQGVQTDGVARDFVNGTETTTVTGSFEDRSSTGSANSDTPAESHIESKELDTTEESRIYGRQVEPLPSLPPRPDYPMDQLSNEELSQLVIPLYSRRWGVIYNYKRNAIDKVKWYKCAVLSRAFEFTTFEATMDFVTEVARLSQAEDHYPAVTFENKNVYLHTFTSHTFRDRANSENLEESQRPGLSLRDVRFAILIEESYSRYFLASGHAIPAKGELPVFQRPQSVAEIENHIQMRSQEKKQSKPLRPAVRYACRVCGGPHDPLYCPERHTKPPPEGRPCKYCGQDGHWSMNCQSSKIERAPKRTSAPVVKNESRPARCPACGGNHWRSDCPSNAKSQNRPPPPLLTLFS